MVKSNQKLPDIFFGLSNSCSMCPTETQAGLRRAPLLPFALRCRPRKQNSSRSWNVNSSGRENVFCSKALPSASAPSRIEIPTLLFNFSLRQRLCSTESLSSRWIIHWYSRRWEDTALLAARLSAWFPTWRARAVTRSLVSTTVQLARQPPVLSAVSPRLRKERSRFFRDRCSKWITKNVYSVSDPFLRRIFRG